MMCNDFQSLSVYYMAYQIDKAEVTKDTEPYDN